MKKFWFIGSAILILAGIVVLVSVPLVKRSNNKKRETISIYQYTKEELKELGYFSNSTPTVKDTVLRSPIRVPKKTLWDSILASYKEILATISSTLGAIGMIKQVFDIKKQKAANTSPEPKPVQRKEKTAYNRRKKEPTKH